MKNTLSLLLVIFACGCGQQAAQPAPPAPKPAARPALPTADEVVVKDPANPKGMRLRRPRQKGEEWTAYFTKVMLWPYTDEYYNQLFTTMDQDGHHVQFIPEVIFEVDGCWILVLRGDPATVKQMGQNVTLELVGRKEVLKPTKTITAADPTTRDVIGFVEFTKPALPTAKVMSSFALFGNAGGVAEPMTEHQVIQHYKVLRDLVDVIVEEVLTDPKK